MKVYEPYNSNITIGTSVLPSNQHVREVIEAELDCYPDGYNVSELSTLPPLENMKTVSASTGLTFPEDSVWVKEIPEAAHYVGVYFNMVSTSVDSDSWPLEVLHMYVAMLGCIKDGTVFRPVTMLKDANFVKGVSNLKTFGGSDILLARYQTPLETIYTVCTSMASAKIPAGVTHIGLLKQFKDSTANALPADSTLKTFIRFW